MKKFAYALFLLASIAGAQTQTITGTATDSDGQVWSYGTYRVEFYPNPSYPNLSQYYVDGSTPLSSYTTVFNGSLNPSGSFSQAGIVNNNRITPVGSQWRFNICPMATSQCGVFQIPVTADADITSTINATIKAPRFAGVYGSYGYNDTEAQIQLTPASWYYNVLLTCLRTYNFQVLAWSCSTTSSSAIPVTTRDISSNATAAQSDVAIRAICPSVCTLNLPATPVSGFFVTISQQGAGVLGINPGSTPYDGPTVIPGASIGSNQDLSLVIAYTTTGYHVLKSPITYDPSLTYAGTLSNKTLACTKASTSQVGCVRVDGTTITIDPATGIISSAASGSVGPGTATHIPAFITGSTIGDTPMTYAANQLTIPGIAINNSFPNSSNLLNTDDASLGQTHQGNFAGALQPQNYYALNSSNNAIANMYSGTGNNPSQLRVITNGDSTAGYHNMYVMCTLATKYAVAGYDYSSGLQGLQVSAGQPCVSYGMSLNSTTGTVTINNGGAVPYDYSRSPNGIVYNISSGGSATFGAGGLSAFGDTFKVYYIIQPSDGTSHATPGTMTVTETTPAGGTCPAGCTLATINTNNASSAGGVTYFHRAPAESATLTVSASGGAVDIVGVGIYDTTVNGIIVSGGTNRGGLTVADSVSTPAAITAPWMASLTGQPALITSWSCTGTIPTAICSFVTSPQAQPLYSGQKIILSGFLTTTTFNGYSGTVSATGLSSTGFQMTVTTVNAGSRTETGYALGSDSNALVMSEWKNNGGATLPNCTLSATLGGGPHNYPYWYAQYQAMWQTNANPLDDLEFTGSYDVNDGCIPVLNEAQRKLAHDNGYVFYDNYFPASWAKLENYGMLGNNVHSGTNEQLAHSMGLWNSLNFNSFLGAEQKPVSNSDVATSNLWIGSNNPNSRNGILCNQSAATCAIPTFKMFQQGAGITTIWNSKRLEMYNSDGSQCWFGIKTSTTGGGVTSTCFFQEDDTGKIKILTVAGPALTLGNPGGNSILLSTTTNSSGAASSIELDTANISAFNGILWRTNGAFNWRLSSGYPLSSLAWQLRDEVSTSVPINLPANTMPNSSISGDANGFYSGVNTHSNGNVNITPISTPTFQSNSTASVGGTLTGSTTYCYRVSAVNPVGETLTFAEQCKATAAGTNTNTVTTQWLTLLGATSYKIYGRTTGAELFLASVPGTAINYTDTGSGTPSGALPAGNTTQGGIQLNSTAPLNHILVGDGNKYADSATLPAAALPSQYKVWACEPGLGDGLNAIAVGTYPQVTCYNLTGVTVTINAIKCFTDNNGTSTMNVTNSASTSLLTGAVTCSATWATGTQSATVTIANGDYLKFSFVSDGTSKQTTWLVGGTY